jgi:hypothetical protein
LFGLEECAGRIGNPKQNELRRVTAFFCGGKVGLIYKMVWFNIKSGGRIWKVIIFDISLQREIKI